MSKNNNFVCKYSVPEDPDNIFKFAVCEPVKKPCDKVNTEECLNNCSYCINENTDQCKDC